MRSFRTLARLVAATLMSIALSGCFVLDEMDKAKAIDMSAAAGNAPKPGAKPGEKPAAGAASAPAGKKTASAAAAKEPAPQGKSWWETAKTLGSEESTAEIVGCKLGRGTEFMQKDDCLARGGVAE